MQKIREYFRTRMAARLWLALVGTVLCVTLCILLLAAVLFNGFMMGNAAGAGQYWIVGNGTNAYGNGGSTGSSTLNGTNYTITWDLEW